MAASPLAEVFELADWTGLSIPGSDPRATTLLSAASGLVRSYTGQSWDDDEVPDVVRSVVVQVAARVWLNPANLESITLDDATRRWGAPGGLGLRLTDADKEALGPYLTESTSGIGTLGVRINDAFDDPTVYVPTGPPPSGYPFPWYAADDLP